MEIEAPVSGWIVEVCVHPGDVVSPGQVLMVMESMKMRIPVTSPISGHVETIHVEEESVVQGGEPLLTLKKKE